MITSNTNVNKNKHLTKYNLSRAFTLVEIVVTIVIIGILSTLGAVGFNSVQKDTRDNARHSQVTVIASALEKYYDDNNEYPPVALMVSQDVTAIKEKLKIKNTDVLKFPLASSTTASSIVAGDPSPTQLVYSANTTDTTKNTQCQTDVSGYCDGFQLQYKKEVGGDVVVEKSRRDSFTPIASAAACDAGDTQNGQTCTRTYAATYQDGLYSCPSGGTLSGTTCTTTYAASYSSGSSGYYYCPSGGSLSGSTCTTTTTYAATWNSSGLDYCRPGYTYVSPGVCRASDGTLVSSESQGYTCPSGGSLSGSTCTQTSSYAASYSSGSSGYYYCSSGGSLSGSTCTSSSAATQGEGYYYCSDGGTVSGSTCTYTYALQ